MNNNPYEVNSRAYLPECWIYKAGRYTLKPSEEHYVRRLPRLSREGETILKELHIPYRIVSEGDYGYEECEYWSPEIYEEEKLTLPVYCKLPYGVYRNVQKKYTGGIPTAYTVRKAQELAKKVESIMHERELRRIDEETCRYLKEALRGRQAIGIFTWRCEKEKDFIFDGNHIKVIPVYVISRNGSKIMTDYLAVFDVNAIELDSIVTMEVPKGQVGLFIGKNHWQENEWCKRFGLKKIDVVGF